MLTPDGSDRLRQDRLYDDLPAIDKPTPGDLPRPTDSSTRTTKDEITAGSDDQVSAPFRLACDATCGCVVSVAELQTAWQYYRQDGAGRSYCGPIAGTLLRLTYHLKKAENLYSHVAWKLRTLYTTPPDPVAGCSGATYHEIGIKVADLVVWQIATSAKLGCELLDVLGGPDLSDADLRELLNRQRARVEAKVCIDRDEGGYPWEQWSEALDAIPVFDSDKLVEQVKIEAAHGARQAEDAHEAQRRGVVDTGSGSLPTRIWSVEDYYRAKEFYEAHGAVFNPALEKGSPAAYHVLAQLQLKQSVGTPGEGIGNAGSGTPPPGTWPKLRQALHAYVAVAQNPETDPEELELRAGHPLVEAVETVQAGQDFSSELRKQWFELQRNANRLQDCTTRGGKKGCRREILEYASPKTSVIVLRQ
jgi:hypothetical protein